MNAYSILGVNQNADFYQIKSAWRKAQIKWHPDRNPGNKEAEEKFKQASVAYDILSDPEKRKQYDQENLNRVFNPKSWDPSKLDKNEFVMTFVKMFGDYIDEQIPGFKEVATYTAEELARQKKEKRVKRKQKKSYKCVICKDTGRIIITQGTFEIKVPCKHCHN